MYDKGEGSHKLMIVEVVLILIAICSLVYYGVILSILGFRKDFSLFWVFMAAGCFVGAVLLVILQKNKMEECLQIANNVIRLGIIVLILFGLIEGLIIKTGYEKPQNEADCIIVLGAHVNGTKVSRALKYRLETAYDYAVEHPKATVIVSGGQGAGEDVTEAQAMRDYLVLKGLDENRIIMEEESTNTNENFVFSAKYIKAEEHVLIVTNRFHLYRSVRIARKQLDSEVEGLGAETGTALFVNYYVREAFAIVKDILMHNI